MTMDATNPNGPAVDDFGGTDHLATSVMRSLSRSFRNQFSMSAIQAIGLGLISFGIWPLARLMRQFRDYAIHEKQQLWYAAEWLRTRRGSEPAAALSDYAKYLRQREGWIIGAIAGICMAAAIAIVLFSMRLTMGHAEPFWPALLARTYQFRHIAGVARSSNLVLAFAAWNIGLSAAYLLQWLRVRWQARELGQYVRLFNSLAAQEGVPELERVRFDSGIRLGWVAVAVILAMLGALWGIPMALAAAAQRRYVNATGSMTRAALLERIRLMLAQQRPAVAVPGYVIHDRRCRNSNCRATLRAGGRFCQRCGTPVTAMERVHGEKVA